MDLSNAFKRVWPKGLIHKLKNNGIDGNLLSLIESLLLLCKTAKKVMLYQRAVLNGRSSKWQYVNSGVPQDSVLGPSFLLIYTNKLPQSLHSDVKLIADDTSFFSVIHDVDVSCATLKNDLVKLQEWAYYWKMFFYPDRNKQAEKVIFSGKIRKDFYPNLSFNYHSVERSITHKYLGLPLHQKL